MGNSAASLPYTIGKQVNTVDGWGWHEGTQKSDGKIVSVFLAKKPSLSKTPVARGDPRTQLPLALNHFTNCKKLRHPHILQVLATLDTDHPQDSQQALSSSAAATASKETGDLIIVTEECMPLDAWLQSNPPPEEVAWGLECIVRALHFLHASANLAHGNLAPASFCVTRSGDVKLWNFSLLTNVQQASGGLSHHFMEYQSVTPQPYQSPERTSQQWSSLTSNGTHAMDSFGLGVLIGHIYNHDIPPPLVKAVQRLQTANTKMRPRLQPLLKCPLFDTPYQKLQLQLEEFNVKPSEEKAAFWNTVTPQLQAQLIPEDLAVYKLLPLMQQAVGAICTTDSMRSQDVFRKELFSMLAPMFYIGEHLLDDFQMLKSSIAVLFTINDRGIRGALLQKASLMSKHLDAASLNQSVFEPLCSGFSDSSPALRELTLKATLGMVPHLTAPNLEKLSRYLVRLQADPESSIRTNTIIFFRKLAPHLAPTTRSKILLPALVRALKDSFTPCRLAALQSTLSAKEFFDADGIARQVLPAVTPSLLDPSSKVRKEAFSVVDDLVFGLRQMSETLGDTEDAAQQQQSLQSSSHHTSAPAAKPQQPPSAPSSGGYFSSWMSKTPAPAPASGPSSKPPQPPAPAPAPVPAMPMSQLSVNDEVDDDDDGWGDDDLDLSNGASNQAPKKSLFAPAAVPSTGDDDFFGTFDSQPAKPIIAKKPVIPSKAPKPAVTKLAVDEDLDDGWDDF